MLASQIATTMISAGAVGLSVLTQPFLFNGSIETLSMVRKVSTVPGTHEGYTGQ